jgi:hypothetical protein
MSLYNTRQQAGTFDRVWNSTLGLPQQVLWRVIRAAKDENIDLFSEKGLLDFALVPGLGMIDDHKEDIMPDYMAKAMGFDPGFGGELAASMLSDPLFYLGGVTSILGKGAKGATQMLRNSAVREAVEATAKSQGKLTDDWLRTATNADFQEVIKTARTGNAPLRTSKKFGQNFDAYERGLSKGVITPDELLSDTLKRTADRKLAVGLPGLMNLGLRIEVPTAHQNWWKLTGSATGAAADKLGVAAVTRMAGDGLGKVPIIGATTRGLTEPVRQFRGGWRAGEETRAVIQHAARTIKNGEDARLMGWTDRVNGAGELVPQLSKYRTEDIMETFDQLTAAGMTTQDAFEKVMRKYSGNILENDSVDQIWSRLIGRGAKDPAKFKLAKSPELARTALRRRLDDAQSFYDSAASLLNNGELTTTLKQNELGELVGQLGNRRKALRDEGNVFAFLSDLAFSTGSKAKALINQGFVTGTRSAFNAKGVQKLIEEAAAGQDRVDKLGKAFYKGLNEALLEMPGSRAEDVESLLYHMMTGRPLTDELVTATSLARINPKNADEVLRSFQTFLTRHHGSMRAIEGLLDSSGLPQIVRDRIAANFNDEIGSMLPALDKQQLTTSFDQIAGIVNREGVKFDRFDQALMRRAHNKHTLYGGRQSGRFVGELSDDEITSSLMEIESQAQREMTPKEVAGFIDENPDLAAFKARHGLTDAEVIESMRRGGKKGNRRIKREELVERPLWQDGRTRWTSEQARSELDAYKLQLHMTENGYRLSSYAGLSDRHMRRLGLSTKQEYRTVSEAMQAVRDMLASNNNYRTKYGPDLIPSTRKIDIPLSEISTLRRSIGKEGQDILAGKGTVFDETEILGWNELGAKYSYRDGLDYRRLRSAQDSRAASRTQKLKRGESGYDGPVKPIKVKLPGEVSDPVRIQRGDIDLMENLLDEGVVASSRQPTEYAMAYGQARMAVNEARAYLRAQTKAGVESPVIPHELLDDIHSAMNDISTIVDDIVLEALPPKARALLDGMRGVQQSIFFASLESGVFGPGSPIGYLGRFFSKNGRARIERIIGNMDSTDTEIATRLGMRNSTRFKRTTDSLTVDELDELHAALREASASGDPNSQRWFDELEEVMKDEGYTVRGHAMPYDETRLSSDPVASLLTRLSSAQQEASIEDFFGTFLKASGKAPGESLALGGTVVGVLDSAKNPISRKFLRSSVRRTTDPEQGTTTLALRELEQTEDVVPQYIKIRTDDGDEHIVSLGIEESGFGFLPLGRMADEATSGVKPTSSRAFVRASAKADLDGDWIDASNLTSRAALDQLMDTQVVFGNQRTITAAAKAVSNTAKVAPEGWRMFDTINYGIKLFQTAFRVPFQAYNLASGVFQASAAGVSPNNLAASYMDTMKLLWGDTRFLKHADQTTSMLDVQGMTHSGVTLLPHNDVVDAIRRAGGSLPNNIDPEVLRASRLGEIPNASLDLGGGRQLSLYDLMQAAAEGNLFGTFATSISRGSRTVSDSLINMRMAALMEGGPAIGTGDLLGGKVRGFFDRLTEKLGGTAGELRETGEVINRMSTVIGLAREGHPLERAVEIAKNAHVPYERLTPFERNGVRRAISYYSFPRHYMPWAWSKFAENPSRLSRLANTIKNQRIVTTDEGKAHLKLGEYRVDLGRLNANFEAALTLATFGDRLAIPFAEAFGFGDSAHPFSPRLMERQLSDAGIQSYGGIFGIMTGGGELISGGERNPYPRRGMFEQAQNAIWPFKVLQYTARELGYGSFATQEERSPYVDYTDTERWILDSDFGLGIKKASPHQETMRAVYSYRDMIQKMKMRLAATSDERMRKKLIDNIKAVNHTAVGLMKAGMAR